MYLLRNIHHDILWPISSQYGGCWWPGAYLAPGHLQLTCCRRPVGASQVSAFLTLQWRHNDHDGDSNHQPHGCLLNRLFRRRSKKTSKLRVTGLCVGNWPGPVNSPHKGPVTRIFFHLMTSSRWEAMCDFVITPISMMLIYCNIITKLIHGGTTLFTMGSFNQNYC